MKNLKTRFPEIFLDFLHRIDIHGLNIIFKFGDLILQFVNGNFFVFYYSDNPQFVNAITNRNQFS